VTSSIIKRDAFVLSFCAALFLNLAAVGAQGSSHGPKLTRVPARAAQDACGLPPERPLWIDYGEGSVKPDVRAVLARPGVVVASSGSAIPAAFRRQGAATVYFDLHLPRAVGEPADPADPATIPDAAATLLAQARSSTACPTPWIALNELLGASTPTPWSPATEQYRANVLLLLQQLTAGGAHPALLVHGDPSVAGAAADWWHSVAQSSDIVYEAYYDATRIYPMGALMGTRRMRMGMRNVVRLYEDIGIPPARLGFMLGFHVARTPGIAGRQGLEPREAWLRVVKWEALSARQIAADEGISSIWSWGWGTFGPESVDPDKPAAACTYLWARDPSLCDAPGTIGPTFEASRAEGPILLPQTAACIFQGGRVSQAAVDRLAALTGDPQAALTAQFERVFLSRAAAVSSADVLAAEQAAVDRSFKSSRQAYLRALERNHASVAVARGVIADELRRRALAASLASSGSEETVFAWTQEHGSALLTTAICRDDLLPGTGNFPVSDSRDVGAVPLASLLPFLFADHTPPGTPQQPVPTVVKNAVTLAWAPGPEADLAGYDVLRSLDGTVYTKLNADLLPVSSFTDATLPAGTGATYEIRALDTSGNRSLSSPSVAVGALASS
jgi:hypothetical protein